MMTMNISAPNENGILCEYIEEIVASYGRSRATVNIALCSDERYRYSVSLMYSYGGFGGPICDDYESFDSVQAAKLAGMATLLRRWDRPFPSDPKSVHDELHAMRHQAASNCFMEASSIAVMPIPEEGLGVAINDRLKRAAAGKS